MAHALTPSTDADEHVEMEERYEDMLPSADDVRAMTATELRTELLRLGQRVSGMSSKAELQRTLLSLIGVRDTQPTVKSVPLLAAQSPALSETVTAAVTVQAPVHDVDEPAAEVFSPIRAPLRPSLSQIDRSNVHSAEFQLQLRRLELELEERRERFRLQVEQEERRERRQAEPISAVTS